MSHVWYRWGEEGTLGRGGGKGQNGACEDEALDSKHETSVDGSLHPGTKDSYPK